MLKKIHRCLADKSLKILIQTATFNPLLKGRQVTTYEDLMFYPFGDWGRGFILLGMFVLAYGAMVAYLIIIKDTVPKIIGFDNAIEREVVLLVTSLCIMLPLSIQRDMASLSLTSFISASADVALVIFITIYSPVSEVISEIGGIGEILRADSINPNIFVGLGIISTAMCCQHASFLIYGSLANNSLFRWKVVSGISVFIATFLSETLGISGYLGFMEETEGDVLNNFPSDSIEANVARGLLALTMILTYPMESFVGRHVLVDLIHNGEMESTNDGDGCLDNCLFNRRQRMTVFLYILAMIPAMIFDNLGPVLSITGAVGGSCLAYIGPGTVFLGVNGDAFLEWAGGLLGYKREDCLIELPIAGNANFTCQTTDEGEVERKVDEAENLELPVAGVQIEMVTVPSGCKPVWWYFFGFPIWCWIASSGSRGMRRRLSYPLPESNESEASQLCHRDGEEEMRTPCQRDFSIAVFYILFGVTGLTAGLVSNIYIQLNKIAV